MSAAIHFFKTIDDDLANKIEFSLNDIAPYYYKNGSLIPLRLEKKDDSLVVSDDSRQWDIEKDGLSLKFNTIIKNPSVLFGERGVTDSDSVLGIGAICQSMVSDRLEAFPLSSFTFDKQELFSQHEITLSSGKYRGNVAIRLVLYLIEPGTEKSSFPKRSGTIFGDLNTTVLKLFENSSLFPIYEIDAPGEPLWWVKIYWTDIENDPFIEENIAIVINKSSKYYPQLDQNNESTFNPILLAEVVSSSICVILEKVRNNRNDWDKITSDSSYPYGTIAFTIQYIYSTLNLDFETQESLALSVRRYVYEKMGLN